MKSALKKTLGIMLAAIILGTMIVGCASQTKAPEPSTSSSGNAALKRLVFSRGEDVLTFDNFTSNLQADFIMVHAICDPLIWQAPDGSFTPYLCTKWEVNENSTEWTFYLRDGVKFSNGKPLTAKDVKATFEYPAKNNLLYSGSFRGLEVQIINDLTVKLIFDEPNGAFSTFAYLFPIFSEEVLAMGPDEVAKNPIGSGPYKLKEWNPTKNVILERNPNFWGDAPYYDEIEYAIIVEDSTRLAALQTGEIDIADGIPADMYDAVNNNPNLELLPIPACNYMWLGLACDKPPFNDKKAREALSLCLDRQVFIDMMGGGMISTGILPSLAYGDATLPPLSYDPARAKQLLEESSYNGEQVSFLSFTGVFPKSQEQLEAVAAMMAAVGFNVNLEIFTQSTFMERRSAELYHLFWTGTAMFGLDPDILLTARILNNSQHFNYTGPKADELNNYINKGREPATYEGRKEAYKDVLRVANEEFAPIIPMYETVNVYACNSSIDLSNMDVVFRGDLIIPLRNLRGK